MNDTPARASAKYFNLEFTNAIKRGKAIIDRAMQLVGASGYPPLTLPLTLSDLKQMPEEKAVAALRSELERTAVVDPVTQEPRFQPQTLRLIADYLEWRKQTAGAEQFRGAGY